MVYGAHYVTGENSGRIGKHKDGCESVAISDELNMGVSCSIDNEILIYDLKGLTVRHRVTPTQCGGFTKVQFSTIPIIDSQGDKSIMLYAASTLGDLFIIDVRSGVVVKAFKGHAAPINYFVEAKQREWVITAGDDNQCNIF